MGSKEGLQNKPLHIPRQAPKGIDPETWRYIFEALHRIEDKGRGSIEAHDTAGGQNLLGKGSGIEHSAANTEAHVYLDDVSVDVLGVTAGEDVLSFGGYVRNDDSTSEVGFRLTFKDSGGSTISTFDTDFSTLDSNQRVLREDVDVPSNTDSIRFVLYRNSGTGTATGKYAVLNLGKIVLRFTEAPLRLDREDIDDLDDGATYARPRGNQMGEGVLLRAKSDNLVLNPIFADDEIGNGTNAQFTEVGKYVTDGWKIFQNDVDNNGDPLFEVFVGTLGPTLFGNRAMVVNAVPSTVVPATSGDLAGAVDQIEIPVKQGDVLFFGGSVKAESFGTVSAGVNVTGRISLLVQDDGGTDVLFATAKSHTANTVGFETDFNSVEMTDAGTAKAIIRLELLINNSNATTETISASNPPLIRFDGIILARQIRDPRQQYPLGGWNRTDAIPDSTVLSASDAGSNATITIASHDRYSGFGTVAFPSGSITGLSYSTEYDVYADLPDYSVGTVNYLASTDLTIAAQDSDRVYIGRVTTPASGAGGTSGGIEACLCLDQWVGPDKRAGELQVGDTLVCMTDAGRLEERAVQHTWDPVPAECVELRAESGARLRCSARTPIITQNGWTFAQAASGEVIFDDAGNQARIEEVKSIGEQVVRRISVGGASFAGGVEPDRLLYSHNAQAKP